MKKVLSLLTLVMVLVVSACGGGSNSKDANAGASAAPAASSSAGAAAAKADTTPLKIGYTGGFSGATASFGTPIFNAVTYAVDEVNNNGGILGRKIELLKEDNEGDPFKSQQIIDKFSTNKVQFVISGSGSAGALSEKQKLEMNKMTAVAATAGDPKVTNTNDPWFFTIIPTSDDLGGSIAYHAAKNMGTKEVIVFARDDAFGKSIAEPFKKKGEQYGMKTVKEYIYPVTAKDFNSYLSQGIKEFPNAVIAIIGYAPEGGLIAKQARALGYKLPILGNVSLINTEYTQVAGDAANNTIVSTTNYTKPGETGTGAAKFSAAWKAKTGKEPDDYENRGYDSVYLLKTAIEKAGKADPEAARKEMVKLKDFDGASGKLTFRPSGSIQKILYITKIDNGKPKELVGEVDPSKY